jgi:DNA polymerase zeta
VILLLGVIVVDPKKINFKDKSSIPMNTQEKSVIYVENENAAFNGILSIIERCDPEILIGWDLEFLSWGYMFQRASLLGRNLSGKISRVPGALRHWEKPSNQASTELHLETLGELRLPGRIVLDVWRLMRHEIGKNIKDKCYIKNESIN